MWWFTSQHAQCVQFLIQNRCFATRAPNSAPLELTHTVLDGFRGGRVIVPLELEAKFLLLYTIDCYKEFELKHGVRLYLNEIHTPVFRFFVDLDLELPEGSSFQQCHDEVWRRVLTVLNLAIAYHYDLRGAELSELLTAIVLRPRDDVGKASLSKLGAHLVYPNLWVSREQALTIRNFAVAVLISVANDQASHRPVQPTWPGAALPVLSQNATERARLWETAVDAGQYHERGSLRMLWSRKISPCSAPFCKGNASRLCRECKPLGGEHGVGRIDRDRAYIVYDCITGDGSKDGNGGLRPVPDLLRRLKANYGFAIGMCSLRWGAQIYAPALEAAFVLETRLTGNGTGTYVEPVMRELPHDLFEQVPQMAPTAGFRVGPLAVPVDAKQGPPRRGHTVSIPLDGTAGTTILEMIRGCSEEYKHINLHSIETNSPDADERTAYTIRVSGLGSSFCQNKKDAHSHSTIYFVLSKKGLQQRCFSKKPTPGTSAQNKKCSEHHGDMAVHIKPWQLVLLFGNSGLLSEKDKNDMNTVIAGVASAAALNRTPDETSTEIGIKRPAISCLPDSVTKRAMIQAEVRRQKVRENPLLNPGPPDDYDD